MDHSVEINNNALDNNSSNSNNNANYTNYTVEKSLEDDCASEETVKDQKTASITAIASDKFDQHLEEGVYSMTFNKRGFTKIGVGNSSRENSSSSGTLEGRGRAKKTIFIPKVRSPSGPSDCEDEGCETDSSMPNEETPLRRRKGRYEKEYAKLAMAVLLVFICTIINGLVIAYINRFSVIQPQSLPDVIFNMVPQQIWAWETADVIVLVCPLFTMFILLFHKHHTIIFTRLCLLAAMLYILRALFLLCTYLPPPFTDFQTRCFPGNFTDDWRQLLGAAFGLVFRAGFSSDQSRFMCGDTIFSGHALIFTLVCLFLWRDTPGLIRPFPAILITVATIFGLTCVLISRQHYTIDIVIAMFVTWSMFRLFHRWTGLSRQRHCFSFKPFRFRPVLALFLCFERNVPRGRLPADLAWPLPFPELLVRFFARLNQQSFSGDRSSPDLGPLDDPESGPAANNYSTGSSQRPREETLERRVSKNLQQQPFDV